MMILWMDRCCGAACRPNASWSPGATVLTGDYVFARAADFAARTNNVRVMHIFSRTLMVLVNGEINQMFKSKGMASREDYYRRIYAKTASVFEAATEAAGVTAAPPKIRSRR